MCPWDKINGLPRHQPVVAQQRLDRRHDVLANPSGSGLYQLAGGVGSNTHFYHFRIIDDVSRRPQPVTSMAAISGGSTSLSSSPIAEFLNEARDLPDGNIYNVHGGSGLQQTATRARPKTATSPISSAFQEIATAAAPARRSGKPILDFEDYFAFNAMNLAINNSDMRPQENVNYYHNEETGKWHILPWDIDLTFEDAPHHGRGDTSAWERIYHCLQYSSISQAYENKVREILNLLLDNDQSAHLVDEFAGFLTKGGRYNIVEAGQAVWDYHPRKNKKGIWYANFNSSLLPQPNLCQPRPVYQGLPDGARLWPQ